MANKKPNNFHARQVHSERRSQQQGRGRDAERPTQIPTRGWKDILWRVIAEVSDDRAPLIAAGTTFYLLLALFPALAAFVSIYGFVADPKTMPSTSLSSAAFYRRAGSILSGHSLSPLPNRIPAH